MRNVSVMLESHASSADEKPSIWPGQKGDAAPPGVAVPHWIGVKIEGFDLITVLSDGTLGPRINLQEMFLRGTL